MTNFEEQALTYLSRLAARPAVAFHEQGVAAVALDILAELEIARQIDDYGNIIAHRPGAAAAAAVPPLAFIAHLDHPGFEAVAATIVLATKKMHKSKVGGQPCRMSPGNRGTI